MNKADCSRTVPHSFLFFLLLAAGGCSSTPEPAAGDLQLIPDAGAPDLVGVATGLIGHWQHVGTLDPMNVASEQSDLTFAGLESAGMVTWRVETKLKPTAAMDPDCRETRAFGGTFATAMGRITFTFSDGTEVFAECASQASDHTRMYDMQTLADLARGYSGTYEVNATTLTLKPDLIYPPEPFTRH